MYGHKLGKLYQGISSQVYGTNTIMFMHKHAVTSDWLKDITYRKIVCDCKENKEEPNQTQLTVSDDWINYPGDFGTPTAKLLAAKILFNSVLSTTNSKFKALGNYKSTSSLHWRDTNKSTSKWQIFRKM